MSLHTCSSDGIAQGRQVPACSSNFLCVPACRYVYDGVFEAQFFMLHDSNKRLLALGDIYPEAKELKKVSLTGCSTASPLPGLCSSQVPDVASVADDKNVGSGCQECRQPATAPSLTALPHDLSGALQELPSSPNLEARLGSHSHAISQHWNNPLVHP